MPGAGSAFLRGSPTSRAGTVAAAVLVLHGGRELSTQATAPRQAAVVRMLDMYVGLRRHSRGAAVYLLRYRLRGWNADPGGASEPAPVVDVRWALAEIAGRHGDVPVALLGHSMGGRTAFAVADDPRVVGVCALAPWLPGGEPLPAVRADQRFVIAHGTADRTTSAAGSLSYAQRLRDHGASVARLELTGGRHALLESARLWHRLAVDVSLGLTGDGALPAGVARALTEPSASSLRLPMEFAWTR
ncbi:MAG: alpha/beta hydrolase [Nocardioidaceae bacterium]